MPNLLHRFRADRQGNIAIMGAGCMMLVMGCAALGLFVFGGYAVVFSTPLMVRAYQRSRRWIEGILSAAFAYAGIRLLERAGAHVVGCSFVIDLPELGGADKLRAIGKPVTALVAFEGH